MKLEKYSKTIHIEALTMLDMITHQFAPAVMKYMDTVSGSIIQKKQADAELASTAQLKLLKTLSAGYDKLAELSDKLTEDVEKTEKIADSLTQAKQYHEVVLTDMSELRKAADALETLIPSDILPYPTYEDILFYV